MEQAIEKLFELYEDGTISKQKFAERMVVHDKNEKEAQGDIEKYRQIVASNVDVVTMDNIGDRVNEIKQLWSTVATSSEYNRAYKLL